MNAALLAMLLLVQQQAPAISATVDRPSLAVGEMVTLTVRVEARGNAPVEIGEPVLDGLERRGVREQSQVSIQGGISTRVTTRQIQLLAERPGQATIRGLRVKQGDQLVESPAITVTIDARAVAVAGTLSPQARALLGAMPPPGGASQVSVGLVAGPTTLMVGQQVDLLVVAWFPREVRLQLRSPPTISGPDVRGAWVYPQPAASGIAASRQVEGRWFDLFVVHHVLFPLSPGRLVIGRARATYALPISYSVLTRELQHEVQSQGLTLTVRDTPAEGRPRTFNGMAAGELSLRMDASPRTLSVGNASRVQVTLRGRGNVGLWPPPDIAWPDEVRVYPDGVEQSVQLENGEIVGSKRFDYLLVPDSGGVHTIRGARLGYFDLESRRYASVASAPLEIIAGEGGRRSASRPEPPPLWPDAAPDWRSWRPPPFLLLLVATLPPLLALLVRAAPAVARIRRRRRAAPEPETLDAVYRQFRRTLDQLVPEATLREGDRLADALRAAGVDPAVAAHSARLRDRLRQAVYGPSGSVDPEELGAEVTEVVKALLGGQAAGRPGGPTAGAALLAAALLSLPAVGSSQTAERLYVTGAYDAAADSFAARAARAPRVAAHWFNLGLARYQGGDEVAAKAAWLVAGRLAPRDAGVRRALGLLPAPDPFSAELTPVAPVTPAELWIVAMGLWVLCWLLALWRRRWRVIAVVGLSAVGAAAAAGLLEARYAAEVALVRRPATPLRSAPYRTAAARRSLDEATAVQVSRRSGAWLLVHRGNDAGWVLSAELERI